MHKFKITWRLDAEDYFCTDSIVIQSDCCDVVSFVLDEDIQNKVLKDISSRNTIFCIERID